MPISSYELWAVASAILAILMLGTTHVRANLYFYTLHTLCIAMATAQVGHMGGHFLYLAFTLMTCKAVLVPLFLASIVTRIRIQRDSPTFLPLPLCMHIGIALMGVGYLLSAQMPGITGADNRLPATAAFSLIFTGIMLMLTRKVALSQIVGFLVIENGIFLFGLSETHGMPLMVEMGILLDLLVGVMIGGILLLRIKKSFEHIDVTQLTTLRD